MKVVSLKIVTNMHIYQPIYHYYFQSCMILLKMIIETIYKELRHLWNSSFEVFDAYIFARTLHVKFISSRFLILELIWGYVGLNAKIIHAKFVTKKYNNLFEWENDRNKGMFRDVPYILLVLFVAFFCSTKSSKLRA